LGMIDPNFMDNIFEVILKKGDIRPIVESLESYEVSQILDEISIYLKQKMLLNDIKFELYLFDRFFRIIADSKQLLNMNSDSGFVLILSLSKMIEAVNLKTIDEVINQVENIKVNSTTLNKAPFEEKTKITTSDVLLTESNLTAKIDRVEEQEIKIEDESQIKYKKLIDIIYEKSYELGECFEKSFTFSSYENNVLKINSSAQGECKTKLYKNFAHIKMFVAEVYGMDTQLDFAKIQKEQDKEMARIVQPSVPLTNNTNESSQEQAIVYEQPSSCIASMSAVKNPKLSQQDLNIDDVLNSKMTSTAMKLFQSPNSPRIKSKL